MNKEELKNFVDEVHKLSQEGKPGTVVAKSQLPPGDADTAEAKDYRLNIHNLALIMEAAEKGIPYQWVPATQPSQPKEPPITSRSPPNIYYSSIHPPSVNEKKEEGNKLKTVLDVIMVVCVAIAVITLPIAGLLLYYFSDWKDFIAFLHELADVWIKIKHPPSSS